MQSVTQPYGSKLLPGNFQFSQASLQDYVDCPRRFQLRYMLHLSWPALQAEPPLENERYLKQGETFHRMVQQNLCGIPAARLTQMVHDNELGQWWQNYLQYSQAHTQVDPLKVMSHHSPTYFPEFSLSAPFEGHRLVAKYDLLVIQNGACPLIFDWKTSRKRPKPAWLKTRLQTRVYPYVLVRAGNILNQSQPFLPEQVEMVYWFAASPNQPERLPYTLEQFERDEAYLSGLVREITCRQDVVYPMGADEQNCRFCNYRSLCERGTAGHIEEVNVDEEAVFSLAFDFEQIVEIKF